jgi:hypothetical protein
MRFHVIRRDTLPSGIRNPKVELGDYVSLVRRFAIPRHRFHVILWDTLPEGIRNPKVDLSVCVSSVRIHAKFRHLV